MKFRYSFDLVYNKCNKPTETTVGDCFHEFDTPEEQEKEETILKNKLIASGKEHLARVHPCGTNGCLTSTLWRQEETGKKTKICQVFPYLEKD